MTTSLIRRVALGLALMAGATAAQARDLTIVAWGGSSQAAQDRVYYQPFSQTTGVPFLQDSWSGGVGILRAKVQAGNANWDVVQVESDELAIGCDEGLYERIDWAALGGRERFQDIATVSDCGVGMFYWSVALAYDANRFPNGPRSWVDFWDVQRFPGKRALRRGAKYTLEIALMGDGVPPEQVYQVLHTPEGIERAFRSLDRLRPHLVWWTAGSQPPQLLASGEVAMAASYTTRIGAARTQEGRNFRIVWPGSIYAVDSYVVLRGSPNRENAMRFIQFAANPQRQAALAPLSFNGPTLRGAAEGLPPEVMAGIPSSPENLVGAIPVDVEFWTDNVEALTQRLDAWAAR